MRRRFDISCNIGFGLLILAASTTGLHGVVHHHPGATESRAEGRITTNDSECHVGDIMHSLLASKTSCRLATALSTRLTARFHTEPSQALSEGRTFSISVMVQVTNEDSPEQQ